MAGKSFTNAIKNRNNTQWLWTLGFMLLLVAFWTLNLLFLDKFPFVHSDENWLSGLTRNMMDSGSLGVTETFFDYKPRYPHTIKTLFHLLQMPFLILFGHTVFAVRLLSLLGGGMVLALFWRGARYITGREGVALAMTALLACDVQFLCAAHLARQEILLCAAVLGCLLLFLREDGPLKTCTVVKLAVATSLAVGLHPNSFLLAVMCGCILLVRRFCFHTANLRQLFVYVVVTGGVTAIFVAASFWMDPLFPIHYLSYGESEYDLLVPMFNKLAEMGAFFQKLWFQVSGTYYIPELRPQLVLFPILLALSILYSAVMRKEEPEKCQKLLTVVAAAGGLLLGTVMIGRYNQTSFVFFVLVCWLLLGQFCDMFGKWTSQGVFAAVFVVVFSMSICSIKPWLTSDYGAYLDKIAQYVPADARTIASLNSDFYFENDALRDYRNLSFLAENGLSFAEYVEENKIEYLVLSGELDRIYSTRPTWNIIYGNLADWYPEMKSFLSKHCTERGVFVDPFYGARVIPWLGDNETCTVHIYQVNRP